MVNSVTGLSNGNAVIGGSLPVLTVWNPSANSLVTTIKIPNPNHIMQLPLPDGRKAVAVSSGVDICTVSTSSCIVLSNQDESYGNRLALTTGGLLVLCVQGYYCKAWNYMTFQLVFNTNNIHKGRIWAVIGLKDGNFATASGDFTSKIVSGTNGTVIWTLGGPNGQG